MTNAQPPEPDTGRARPRSLPPTSRRPLLPLRNKARITIVFLSAHIPLAIWSTWLILESRLLFATSITPTELQELVDLNFTLLVAQVAVIVVSGIGFLIWLRGAYYNLSIFNVAEHQLGWVIGAWFVPIVNLWRPYTFVNELWTRSPLPDRAERSSAVPAAWWLIWLCGGFGLDAIFDSLAVELAVVALNLVALGFGIHIVATITNDQELRIAGAG